MKKYIVLTESDLERITKTIPELSEEELNSVKYSLLDHNTPSYCELIEEIYKCFRKNVRGVDGDLYRFDILSSLISDFDDRDSGFFENRLDLRFYNYIDDKVGERFFGNLRNDEITPGLEDSFNTLHDDVLRVLKIFIETIDGLLVSVIGDVDYDTSVDFVMTIVRSNSFLPVMLLAVDDKNELI